jgi:hypothetical protein
MTPEHRAKISLANRGKHPSIQSRQKISKSLREYWKRCKDNGVLRPTGGGHNAGKPAYNRGVKHPSEVIQNIRIGMKRYWKKRKQSSE